MNHTLQGADLAAAIILAAGAASRMGTLKQLLPYAGGTLLTHSIHQAQRGGFERIIVVVGAEADQVKSSIAHLQLEVVQNENWRTGMGSSICAGMQQLKSVTPEPGLVAILLADQPHITAEHLRAMRRLAAEAQTPVVAARYRGVLGVPAFFRPELFPLLASLHADAGARSLFRDGKAETTPFDLPEAAIDIDTPSDFAAL